MAEGQKPTGAGGKLPALEAWAKMKGAKVVYGENGQVRFAPLVESTKPATITSESNKPAGEKPFTLLPGATPLGERIHQTKRIDREKPPLHIVKEGNRSPESG